MLKAAFPYPSNALGRFPKGSSVVEALLSLSLAASVIIVVGAVFSAGQRLERSSGLRQQALGYAREALELVGEIKNVSFSCRCSSDSCGGSTCTRGSDGQPCSLLPGYTSCWTAYPKDLVGVNTPLYPALVGGVWVLKTGVDPLAAGTGFSRVITIENLQRDVNGIIVAIGTIDPNTKRVTVVVGWEERGDAKQISLSTMFTAWESI